MKRKLFGLLVIMLPVLALVSCDQEALNIELDPVNITHRTQNFEFEKDVADFIDTKSGATPLYETQVAINIDSILNTQDGMDAVEEAMIKEIVLGITSPEGLDFDFVKSISCKVATSQATDNDVIVAQIFDIPENQSELVLVTVEENKDKVSEVIRSGNFWVRVYAEFGEELPEELIESQNTVVAFYFNALIEMTLNVN